MKPILRGCVLIVLCLGLASVTTGCWDSIAIDEQAIVLTMGIDLGDEPGTLAVTFEIVKPGGIGAGQEGATAVPDQSFLVTGHGRTLMEAMQSAQRRLSRRIFLSQLQNIIFGEELARQGISPVLDHLQRSGELRRTMSVFVAEGKAKEALAMTPQLIQVRGLAIDGLAFQAQKTGVFEVIFGDFLERITSPGAAAVLPTVQKTSEGVELTISGMGVFQGDRLVGLLNEVEAFGLSLALGRARPQTVLVGEDTSAEGKFFASFSLQSISSSIQPRVLDDEIEASISLRIQSILFEQTSGPNLTTPKGYKQLEQMQEKTVRQAVDAAINRAQEWETDIFGLGEIVEKRFPKAWQQLEDDWPTVFAKVNFNIAVNSRLTETGLILEPLPLPKRSSER